ncbi:MAG: exonuclease SbcCD subunit D [Bacteroidales bacterium]|nr:exonuclease SbcCD subunit D [Bacteroidales bacterium]
MRLLHTADLHIGQTLYQNYGRTDEHEHFFRQLEGWCRQYHPDVLIVSGDVFDIQQPGAAVKEFFNRTFVTIRNSCPTMHIVVTAGNHDSASRLQADAEVWKCINVHIVGIAPTADITTADDGWQERFIVRLPSGYFVAFPYMTGSRSDIIQSVLDYISRENSDRKPVVMMGHLALRSADTTGHSSEIGRLATQTVEEMGTGFDYLALGHIHRPQTLGHPIGDENNETSTYPSGIARYAGSALHVSCDEKYPHTVSMVEISSHGAEVRVQRLRINELRHFYELPKNGQPAESAEEALHAIHEFAEERRSGYFRLRIRYSVTLPVDFDQHVYRLLEPYNEEIRYNPKTLWVGEPAETETEKPVFEVAELQAMDDPMIFIEKTAEQYSGLSLEELRNAFQEVKEEIHKMEEEKQTKP